MFTVKQIETAHAKVKTGADFPKYIQKIKHLGVTAFETWVTDSHTEYFGENDYTTKSDPMYENLTIMPDVNKKKFSDCLKAHQQGKTDYLSFCKDCAATGIAKWFVSLEAMNCIYYDKAGNAISTEHIPG